MKRLGQNCSMLGINRKCNFAPKCPILRVKFIKFFWVIPPNVLLSEETTPSRTYLQYPYALPRTAFGRAWGRKRPRSSPQFDSPTFKYLPRSVCLANCLSVSAYVAVYLLKERRQ